MARRRGSKGFVSTIIWGLFILSCVFAWAKTPVPAGTEGVAAFAQAKSASVNAWVKEVTQNGSNIDISRIFKGSSGLSVELDGQIKKLGGSGNSGSTAFSSKDANKAASTLEGIKTGGEQVAYNRGDWNHWVSSGSSCWNVREEVLAKQAVTGSVVYLDSSKNETKSKSQACSIKSGKWSDPYTGKTFTDPAKLDIDHMIPLSYAAKHGGQAWDSKKKEKYANNLGNSYHLVAVDAGSNRQKGDKGPSQWKPANKAYHCDYAVSWTKIAGEWNLSLDKADKDSIQTMLKTCK